ncbi:MAG: anti-sigma factor family protein [Gemmatimonadota bacterium]
MNHRHLNPDEIGLLVDEGEGFGMAPLRSHLDDCPRCLAEYRSMKKVVAGLEAIPHLAPPPRFSEKVMRQVQVFEPWHVALRDQVTSLFPATSRSRLSFGIGAGAIAIALSVVFVWVAAPADAQNILATLGVTRARDAISTSLSGVAQSVFGEAYANSLQSSASLFALVAGTGAGVVVVAFGLRAIVANGRRRRS